MRTTALVMAFAVLLVMLTGCSGGGDTAIVVAGKFWDALEDQDLEKARSYCTKETAESLTLNEDTKDQDVSIEFGNVDITQECAQIETIMRSTSGDVENKIELTTVLVREDREWKVDVSQTMMSMFGGAMGEMMESMSKTMEDAMEEMSEKMAEEMQKNMEDMTSSMSGE
ncbi:MAG: hypothetical protein JSV33_05015 [bacterium]|nr:MAG: hypothetical protein JSV33_05015 [bacterium]